MRGSALAGSIGIALGIGALAGCQPPGAGPPGKVRPGPAMRVYQLAKLVGTWRWMLRTTERGTTRVEDERWELEPGPTPTQLAGRYVRTVEVRSDDLVPFECNQRSWYRQRAVFDVVVDVTRDGFEVRETGYRAEPSPCDHGFRHVGVYAATLDGERLRLRWGGGLQALWRVDDAIAERAEAPSPRSPLVGRWRWDATSWDAEGNVHDETEWWDLVRRSETRLDATYRRRVTVRSPDGSQIACADAPSWSVDDAYILDGEREEEHWHLHERAVDPGDHPCLRANPRRALDEATAEQLGDHVILEWRGKRRQVLHRPD